MTVGLRNERLTEKPFEKSDFEKMNGLRVYFNPSSTDTPGSKVFYSRRADGPYYRWRVEGELGQWHGSRVHPSDWSLKALSLASWKAVPTTLQAKLGEHYLD